MPSRRRSEVIIGNSPHLWRLVTNLTKYCGLRRRYFSALINEYPKEIADRTKKEINAPTTTNSSNYLLTSLASSFHLLQLELDTVE